MSRSKLRRLPSALVAPAVLAAVIGLWELVVWLGDIKPFILPPPSAVAVTFVEEWPTLMDNSKITLLEIGLGFGLGVIVGLVLAVIMALMPVVRAALYPLVLATQTTPKIAIAPLFIIWFGVGLLPKLLIIALLVFFPVLINTLVGIQSVDKSQLALMRSVDSSQWQIYRHVRMPSAVPHIFASLKLGLTVAIIGAIVAEWVAANEGLGYLLIFYNSTLRTTELFAVLLMLVLIASLAFVAISLLERALSWEARLGTGEGAVTVIPEAAV
jgi:ABC-type nitrate/sulfonate/bicarbonate transport system permease component